MLGMFSDLNKIETYKYKIIYIIYKNISNMNNNQGIQKKGHSPTLNTVLMVEDVLEKTAEVITLAELKKKLPRKVMHQTLLSILDYLQLSGKIVIGTKGILWVFTPREELNELISRGTEI